MKPSDAPSVPPLSNRRLGDLIAVEDAHRANQRVSPESESVIRLPDAPYGSRISYRDEDRAILNCASCTAVWHKRDPKQRALLHTPVPLRSFEALDEVCDNCGRIILVSAKDDHLEDPDAYFKCDRRGLPF